MAETAETGPPTGSRPVPDPTALTTDAVQREVGQLRDLLEQRLTCEEELREEKITSLQDRMRRTEEQRVEQKTDTQKAIDAALTAQQEAVAKSESATYKQLEEIKTTIATTVDGLRREFGDLKERIITVEQRKVGAREERVVVENSDSTTRDLAAAAQSRIYGGAAILVALGAAAIAALK